VTPPAGTFLAEVRDSAIRFPPPIREFCDANNWTLFRVLTIDDHCLEIQPVLPDEESDMTTGYHSSLSPDSRLWIPAPLRALVALGDQSAMMRIENGAIRIYLRKVFETLGFRP
jgi:hypothetical protein